MALHGTTSERELRAIEGRRSVAAAAAAATQRGWGIRVSGSTHQVRACDLTAEAPARLSHTQLCRAHANGPKAERLVPALAPP